MLYQRNGYAIGYYAPYVMTCQWIGTLSTEVQWVLICSGGGISCIDSEHFGIANGDLEIRLWPTARVVSFMSDRSTGSLEMWSQA